MQSSDIKPQEVSNMRFAIRTFLLVAPITATIAFLLFVVGPLLTLLIILLLSAGGLVATLGIYLVSSL